MKAIFWQSTNAVPIKFCQEIIEYAKTRDKSLGVTGSDTKTDDEIKKSLKKRNTIRLTFSCKSWSFIIDSI